MIELGQAGRAAARKPILSLVFALLLLFDGSSARVPSFCASRIRAATGTSAAYEHSGRACGVVGSDGIGGWTNGSG